MSSAVVTLRLTVAYVTCFLALSACGDKKEEVQSADDAMAVAVADDAQAQPAPPPDKERSFLATGCEKHQEVAKKADCLCRVDVMDAMLDEELLAKLQSAPKDGPTSAVVEHLGGMANLSRVYESMRKASQECGQGESK